LTRLRTKLPAQKPCDYAFALKISGKHLIPNRAVRRT
jgi:hypothetical protein